MNYYETDYPYYALIPAKNKEEAMKIYTDEIADDEYGELERDMIEIVQLEAFVKFVQGVNEPGVENLKTLGQAIDELLNAHILLIDGNLR